MAGVAGNQFMARSADSILIGQVADLPRPVPGRGEVFTIVPSPWPADSDAIGIDVLSP
jgi:hypothetical protein